MKKFSFLLTTALLIGSSSFAQRTVSDSLVSDLPCDKVTANEIYRRMSQNQFSSSYHIPLTNWGVEAKNGLYELGVCWSLSRAQRLLFYLNRWNETSTVRGPQTLQVLNMLRGDPTYPVILNSETYPRTDLGMLGNLMDGVSFERGGKNLHRNFRSEIEKYQLARFHKLGKNLKYLIGNGTRSKTNNRQTKDQLVGNLQINKLTMLIVRANRMAQHVVLAKRFERLSNGDINFYVYDSNHPGEDNVLTYNKADSRFYSPGIVYGVVPAKDLNDSLGVYIVDEQERDPVEKVLVRYYSSLCSSLNKP
ncbi:hypothetical protein B9G69_005050 [Bdellovibrio sp. SKB1291214]|uniref:hypothetical protein n=1 Tax=Bdellovibrio sp. SKB1291214 TaxID=1732569 RepID=UPI000B516E3D|nr:hypothetical protein [Bdellovibrio sp. SKB1291214]UYL09942.1 hypothetical protein B9G69_005050 [Bdellovibrio sp. SKB1291214]